MKAKFLLLAAISATFALNLNAQTTSGSTLSIPEGTGNNDGYDSFEEADYQTNAFDGSNYYNSPILFTYSFSGSQTIFTAEDLQSMANSKITAIRFKYNNGEDYTTGYKSNAKIYLQESELTAFEKDGSKTKWFAVDMSSPNAEFDITYDSEYYPQNYEIVFDLSSNPFEYTGKSLVITVSNDCTEPTDDGNNYMGGTGAMMFYKTDLSNRSIVYGGDNTSYADYLAENALATGNVNTENAPAVQFSYIANESGVEEQTIAGASAKGLDGAIAVTVADASRVEVYNVAGQQLANETVEAGSHNLPFAAGLYIVKVNNTTVKVIVK